MKITVLLIVGWIGLEGSLYVVNLSKAFYETTIEEKVQDRIEEEKEKMRGKLAYCERMCKTP